MTIEVAIVLGITLTIEVAIVLGITITIAVAIAIEITITIYAFVQKASVLIFHTQVIIHLRSFIYFNFNFNFYYIIRDLKFSLQT